MDAFSHINKWIAVTGIALSATCQVLAEDAHSDAANKVQAVRPFDAFTGKTSKNKVRMRSQASLEAPVVKELARGELLVIVGESEDFYAVQPPGDIKGYIFRTFVLDNKIEGNKVNIRLSPSTDAPIIGQFNSGDHVEGSISALNNKWLEISLPETSRFFIAKEYIEKVGDKGFMARIAKRRDEVNGLLNSTYLLSQQEFQKSFPDIRLDRITANYQQIMKEYADFPEQSARAKELLEQVQENYLKTKIAYLESKVSGSIAEGVAKGESTVQIAETEYPEVLTHINYWKPHEEALFTAWQQSHQGTVEDFYAQERNGAITITGVLEPYSRMIKNKPGDFMLVDKSTHAPVAFLYSTTVNLQSYVGREVTFLVSPRENNNFAYPAYYVLTTQ